MAKKRKNPNSNPKSGGIGFAITALVLASATGFSFGGIVLGVLLGLGIGKIASIMGSGLDTTTHNKGDDERRAREAAEKARAEAELKRQAAALGEEYGLSAAEVLEMTGEENLRFQLLRAKARALIVESAE